MNLLAYEVHGSEEKPALVLLHGFPFNRQLWQRQHTLSAGSRLVLPDFPGFGETPLDVEPETATTGQMAARVAALLDHLSITRAVVMGHSMGGYVALAFAEQFPERVQALGLLCSQAGADTDEKRAERFKMMEGVREEDVSVVANGMQKVLFSAETERKAPDLIDESYRMMLASSVEGVVGALHAMAVRPDYTAILGTLDMPVLVVAGADDRVVPPAKAREMAERLPDATLELIPDAGHMPMVEQPKKLNKAILTFLRRVAG